MTSSQTNEPNQKKDFDTLEREALEKTTKDTLESDILRFLNKLHRKQREDIEEKISSIEERCRVEIRETLEKHVKLQLEKNFKSVVKSSQENIYKVLSSFTDQATQNVETLNVAVHQTNTLCDEIQKKYSFRWEKPFLITLFSCILTGTFVCIILILLQFSPLAVFLMNKETREIYNMGLRWQEVKKEMAAYKSGATVKAQDEDRCSAKVKKK